MSVDTKTTTDEKINLSHIMPLELIDQAIGTRITAVMNGDFEFTGLLKGFDDFVNMVLEDVTEIHYTTDGPVYTKMDEVLLNGSHVSMLIPGGIPDQ